MGFKKKSLLRGEKPITCLCDILCGYCYRPIKITHTHKGSSINLAVILLFVVESLALKWRGNDTAAAKCTRRKKIKQCAYLLGVLSERNTTLGAVSDKYKLRLPSIPNITIALKKLLRPSQVPPQTKEDGPQSIR